MQIRIANRQDDKAVRALVESIYQGQGKSLDLNGKDEDLRNIERYFARAGLFLVAEDEGEIKAMLAGEKANEKLFTIKRLMGNADTHKAMLEIALNHAYQMDFEKVEVDPDVKTYTGVIESV